MRAIARFMNLSDWVEWGNRMLTNMDSLEQKAKDAFCSLRIIVDCLRNSPWMSTRSDMWKPICKTRGFLLEEPIVNAHNTSSLHVIGNANNRRATLGLRMLDYLKKEAKLTSDQQCTEHVSDIIESDFGISKNQRCRQTNCMVFTSMILMFTALSKDKSTNSVADEQRFQSTLGQC